MDNGTGAGTPVPKVKAKHAVTEEQRNFVLQFLGANSKPFPHIAAKLKKPETKEERKIRLRNRLKKPKDIVCCRCITVPTWTALYKKYCEATNEKPQLHSEPAVQTSRAVSKSAFVKLIPKQYKKPRTKEDLCSACFYGAELEKRKSDPASSSALTAEEEKMLQAYQAHRELVLHRRKDYKTQQEGLKPFQVNC
jgi:hypothetical protein